MDKAFDGYSGQLARALFEESKDVLILFDPRIDGVLATNPAAVRVMGWSGEELSQMQLTSLFDVGTPDRMDELQSACHHSTCFHSQEGFYLRTKGEGWLPVNLTITRLHVQPTTLGLLTARDITERKQVEDQLRASEAKYRTLVENLEQHIFLKDRDLCYVAANRTFCEATGFTEREIVGKTDNHVFPPQLAEHFQKDDRKVLTEGNRLEVEGELLIRGQHRCVHTIKTPVRDNRGKVTGVLGIRWDVTEQRQGQLRQQHSQRLEAIGRLAGGVAHDFNNLLTIINGFASVLLNQLDKQHPWRRLVEPIHAAGERAAGVTKQLLAFSRPQECQPTLLDLNEVVGAVQKMLHRLIGEDIDIATHLEPGAITIKAELTQIEQLLMNLAVNARDAMPQGGRFTITTGKVGLSDREVAKHAGVAAGQYARLAVTDTGCGMDAHTQSRIFEPFFTTKEVGKGTGLGLATVYGIVKHARGFIDVCSAVGKGSTFAIYLPLAPLTQVLHKSASGLRRIPQGGGKILLVEDEKEVRAFIREALEHAGYSVLEAAGGEEAVALFCRNRDAVQLLITDVIMPGMSGPQVCEQIQALAPTMKVLYISGHTADTLANRSDLPAGTALLPKPFGLTDVTRKVHELLHS